MPERVKITDFQNLSEKEILIYIAGAVNANSSDISDLKDKLGTELDSLDASLSDSITEMQESFSIRFDDVEARLKKLEASEAAKEAKLRLINQAGKIVSWVVGLAGGIWAFIETIAHFAKHG